MSTKIFTVAEMVAAERAADAAGVSYTAMMETAGRLTAEAIAARREVNGRRVLVLIGPGNNGGDGLVAGRYLAQMGADVALYLFQPRDPEQDDNYRQVIEMDLFVAEAAQDQRYRVLRTRLAASEILVDALLGTGVTRPITGELAALLKQVAGGVEGRRGNPPAAGPLQSVAQLPPETRAPDLFLCAVDCPSGLNCDSGALDPLALPADLTVTFAGPKRGHFIFPGAAACGELVVADISIPEDLPAVAGVPLALATPQMARALLPARPSDGHKGTFGTAVIAAGSADYWGAPVLAARAAYRAGAGLVALAVPESIRATAAAQAPEATFPALAAAATLDETSAAALRPLLADARAFLFGPGLGAADGFVTAVCAILRDMEAARRPAVIVDADGLNSLARRETWPVALPPWTILTPHPGEMARLTGLDLAELKARERVDLARASAQAWGHVLLLKGAFTVVAAPDGRAAQLPFANPLLAVAGSGDVLSGIIAGIAAQDVPPYEAAVLGAYLHGAAAELARPGWGDAGLLAGELADYVPRVRQRLLA